MMIIGYWNLEFSHSFWTDIAPRPCLTSHFCKATDRRHGYTAIMRHNLSSFRAKRRLKLFTLSAAFKLVEIQFQSLHPRYVNERCPYDRQQRGMCKRLHDRVVLV